MHDSRKLVWGGLAMMVWTIGCSDAASSSPEWAQGTSPDVRRDAGSGSIITSPAAPSSSTPPSPSNTPPGSPTTPPVDAGVVDAAKPAQVDRSPTGAVTRAYLLAFERAPDAGGLAFFVQKIGAGMTRLSVLAALVNSPEFEAHHALLTNEQFVTAIYVRFLHRAPEPAGFTFWVNALASGQTRSSMANAVVHTPEFAHPSNPESAFFF